MTWTDLIAAIKRVSAPRDFEADETFAGDDGTLADEGGGAPGVVSARVWLTWIFLAKALVETQQDQHRTEGGFHWIYLVR